MISVFWVRLENNCRSVHYLYSLSFQGRKVKACQVNFDYSTVNVVISTLKAHEHSENIEKCCSHHRGCMFPVASADSGLSLCSLHTDSPTRCRLPPEKFCNIENEVEVKSTEEGIHINLYRRKSTVRTLKLQRMTIFSIDWSLFRF